MVLGVKEVGRDPTNVESLEHGASNIGYPVRLYDPAEMPTKQ